MKRMIAVLGLVATFGVGLHANAEPSAELRDQVNVMLSAPEYAPSEREWLALGPDAAQVLRDVALNRKVLAVKRGRAATALSYFKEESTRLVLTQLVSADKEAWLVRGKAARALTKGFGEQSLQAVQVLLKDPQKRLREAAVKAIADVASEASRRILQAHLTKEPARYLRLATEKAVARIDARLLERARSRQEEQK